MSALTIRLDDSTLSELTSKAEKLHLTRSEYVRKAIEFMNNMLSKKEKSAALADASMRVRNESMAINAEFAEIEYDPED
jgi:predicted transcriptional regulator